MSVEFDDGQASASLASFADLMSVLPTFVLVLVGALAIQGPAGQSPGRGSAPA